MGGVGIEVGRGDCSGVKGEKGRRDLFDWDRCQQKMAITLLLSHPHSPPHSLVPNEKF